MRKAAAIDPPVQAIRLDSGDLDALSRAARAILDEHDRKAVKIVASGDLDEYRIAGLTAANAPIDGFGVGTEVITSRDAPAMAMVYKLVELDGKGRFKLSPGKKTYPMAKQVFRQLDQEGKFCLDLVTRADEIGRGRASPDPGHSTRPACRLAPQPGNHSRTMPSSTRLTSRSPQESDRDTRLPYRLQRSPGG